MTQDTASRWLDLKAWGLRRSLPMMLQTEASECGLASLAMVAGYHGLGLSLPDLRRRFSISRKGASLEALVQVADVLKLESRPVRLEIEQLPQLVLPCVLHWDMDHFVVLKSVSSRRAVVHDPALGECTYTLAEFGLHFTGVALELYPTHEFTQHKASPRPSLLHMMGSVEGLKRGIAQILLLALALEVVAIGMPFFMQWVVDQVVVAADRDLLAVLGLGFVLLTGFQAVLSALRAWLVLSLSVQLNFQWLGNSFRHLMKLPLEFFEKRHVGHIVSCFGSITTIQKTLTGAFVQALVDGVMVLGTFAMMLLYSVKLASVALVAVLMYGGLRWVVFRSLRMATAEEIIHAAKQQTHFLESAAGVQSVRLFGRAEARRVGWLNMLADQFNAELRIGRIHIGYETANKLLFGTERVLIVWLAALLVIDRQFSLGMLFAFIAYKDQFSDRISALVDKLFELGMLRLHGDRVADIVLTAPEAPDPPEEVDLSGLRGSIELRDISFGYAMAEQLVLRGVNLRIEAGECVAITGPSGCGKTTLAKVMLGLLMPTEGEVLIDGQAIGKLGLGNYRRLIGTVMQDDRLFTGSIADNIAFFDPARDDARVEASARHAAIHEEILAMPMAYNTLVGDIGHGLSGGQKQRVLLARALYRMPRILLLDEATSHLDLMNEKSVNEAVKHMQLTRVVIAHRAETIAMASRVIVMMDGRVARDLSSTPRVASAPESHLPA